MKKLDDLGVGVNDATDALRRIWSLKSQDRLATSSLGWDAIEGKGVLDRLFYRQLRNDKYERDITNESERGNIAQIPKIILIITMTSHSKKHFPKTTR